MHQYISTQLIITTTVTITANFALIIHCEKAVVVLKSELVKMFADITARLETVEKRLAATEKNYRPRVGTERLVKSYYGSSTYN